MQKCEWPSELHCVLTVVVDDHWPGEAAFKKGDDMGAFTDFDRYDGLGLAQLVRAGEVRSSELVEEAISRIETRNPQICPQDLRIRAGRCGSAIRRAIRRRAISPQGYVGFAGWRADELRQSGAGENWHGPR